MKDFDIFKFFGVIWIIMAIISLGFLGLVGYGLYEAIQWLQRN